MKRAAAMKDFFGINHLTNKDIAGMMVKTKLPTDKISSKFSLLMLSRNCPENKEIIHDKQYGMIRYDDDNRPRDHGQYEPRNTNMLFNTTDVKQRYTQPEDGVQSEGEETHQPEKVAEFGETIRVSEIGPARELSKVLALFHDNKTIPREMPSNRVACWPVGASQLKSHPNNGLADDSQVPPDPLATGRQVQQPGHDKRRKSTSSRGAHDDDAAEQRAPLKLCTLSGGQVDLEDLQQEISSKKPKRQLVYDNDSSSELLNDLDGDPSSEISDGSDPFPFQEEELRQRVASGPKNALKYLESIRSGKTVPKVDKHRSILQDDSAYALQPKILLDSQGFKNYSRQVPNWDACRHVDILDYLKRSILYHNYDVLAVNKPYGLASHSDSKRDKLDMNTLMHELAAKMNIEKVYLAHRLDKTTTGVLLFATSQQRADQLNKLFKSDQIKKTYWCILRGTPDPEEAIIDIPIGEYSVAGKVRSCLAPEKIEKERQMTKRYREARRAITEYSVIQSQRHVSLVEVKPRSGVKHQIRCHFGFGLNRPILGDHKYSHLGKLAPQVLSVPLLNKLHLRQAKVRTLPIHLHAKTIVVPNVKPNGQNLFIEATLPPHFKENLKSLGLLSKEVINNM